MRIILCIALMFVLGGCFNPKVEEVTPPMAVRTAPATQKLPAPLPPRQLGPLVMIDPGHGGPKDTGTKGRLSPEYVEKDLTLTTAVMVKGYLDRMGFKTTMIRQKDVFINRYVRARLANEQEPAVYVSIHYNHAPDSNAQGIEIFYYNDETRKTRSDQSKQLAQDILKRVLAQTGAKSRGVKQGNYAVIRETHMPAVIIEGGFLTNEEEMNKIKDPAYLKKIAMGIAEGINDYLR